MIKVLIVEDSPVMQQSLIQAIRSDPRLTVVGVASDGEKGIDAVRKFHPDVIAMDWQMPVLDGLQATRIIMETIPTPIVIVTGNISASDATVSFRLLEAGALAVIMKPHGIGHPAYRAEVQKLNATLKLMSEIKLVKRTSHSPEQRRMERSDPQKTARPGSAIRLVAIGASTGGPLVLQKILSGLPADFPVPVLIVQHISYGFVGGFVEWLQQSASIPLHLAVQGEVLLPGHGYIAPDDYHMGVANGQSIMLSDHAMENGLRPSVAYLFRTVAAEFGSAAVGILLTGMGRDGAAELKLMKENGSVTIAQDKESSIVHGMPGEAIKLDAATYVLSPEEIQAFLVSAVEQSQPVNTARHSVSPLDNCSTLPNNRIADEIV